MTQSEARIIAENFIKATDMRGYSVVYADARKDEKNPDEWLVRFDLFSPKGGQVDSPTFVFVNERTGDARFFEGSL
jgi:hypothetical protein